MMYQLYQAQTDLMTPFRLFAKGTGAVLKQFDTGRPESLGLRQMTAALEMLGDSGMTHLRPSFGFSTVLVGNEEVPVVEEDVLTTPFATLLRFRKDMAVEQPKVLVVAPMSGHFATLLRATVQTLLPDHDVYVTNWMNARDVPLSAGRFGMDEFIEHVIRFQEAIGPGGHVLAVCQPAVPVLAAVAVMAEDGNPATPASMTLMAGPIDTRVSPTKVNELAQSHPIAWFEQNLIDTVPWQHPGGGRKVYPGMIQLTAFLSMNLNRHIKAHLEQFRNLVGGDSDLVDAHRRFYDEYMAVMDLPAEFYIETVRSVFQDHDMPLGRFTYKGRPVRPEAITETRLLTVEGERDDICAIGQTAAALELCSGLPSEMKSNHVQSGVGHYGVFSGRRWNTEVYPLVRALIEDKAPVTA